MGLFSRRKTRDVSLPSEDMVKAFLRAQNLEQVGQMEEAIDLYELAVEGRFDSAGPYDRLLTIYTEQARHKDIIRIAQASIDQVRTYPEKLDYYRRRVEESKAALESGPKPR